MDEVTGEVNENEVVHMIEEVQKVQNTEDTEVKLITQKTIHYENVLDTLNEVDDSSFENIVNMVMKEKDDNMKIENFNEVGDDHIEKIVEMLMDTTSSIGEEIDQETLVDIEIIPSNNQKKWRISAENVHFFGKKNKLEEIIFPFSNCVVSQIGTQNVHTRYPLMRFDKI
jgi:hypothetical protein